jgi:hypothetical protein
MNIKRLFLSLVLLFVSSSCSPRCEDDDSCKRVLFIGNSYTFVNDLPATLTALAKSGDHRIETGMAAEGGMTLTNHVDAANTANQISSSPWDFVVLQEQSQIPSVKQFRIDQMYPAARTLVRKIENAGAEPLFFIPWAHRDGWPENGMQTYMQMQGQIERGYFDIANELDTPMAPVGFAWAVVVKEHPEIILWQEDGSHPTKEGTYLAACVFYAVLFQESPEGLSYRADISKDNAAILQKVATEMVLENLNQWNIK